MLSTGTSKLVNPGEPLLFQGEIRQDFFGVLAGRFAKVKNLEKNAKPGPNQVQQQPALIEIVDRPYQVIGEVESLLELPLTYSAYALDPGEVVSLPIHPLRLQNFLGRKPRFGLRICTSFARKLREALGYYSLIIKEEENIQQTVYSASRAYLAVVNEIEEIVGKGRSDPILERAKQLPAYRSAKCLEVKSTPKGKTPSVYCAVVRPPTSRDRLTHFAPGTLLCRKNTLGDRLFILMEGVVEVLLGPDATVQIARPGSLIGEIAVLLNMAAKTPEVVRTADVVAVTAVTAIVVGLQQAEAFLESRPEIMANLLIALIDRTKETLNLTQIARSKLHEKLFSELRPFLEGHHILATELSKRQANLAFSRPFHFTAHQSRLIFNAFSKALQELKKT